MRRVVSALVFLPLFILLVRLGSPGQFVALLSVAAAWGAWEFFRLLGPSGLAARWAGVLGAVALLLALYLAPYLPVALALWGAVLVFFSLGPWLPKGTWEALRGYPGLAGGVLFLGATFGSLALLRDLDSGWRHIFFLFLIIWGGDTAAYYVGRGLGRRPLMPSVSPRKTVEGAVGGLAASLVGALLGRSWFFPFFGWGQAAAAGLLLGAVGQLGDLSESALKRAAGVKDAGALIPGHGGLLDRADGILFGGPVFYAAWRWWQIG